jgi:DNA modification methylase
MSASQAMTPIGPDEMAIETSSRTAGWRNRIVGSGSEAPAGLALNPANWRVHPRNQRAALAGSLDTVGWVAHVLVNRQTGYVLDGHARVALAIARKEPTVPVLYVDLSSEEEKLILATFDPIGAMAGSDDARLRGLLADVAVDDAGLRALLDELALSAAPYVGLADPDAVPEPAAAPAVQRGEVWQLGKHRVGCLDATNADDVARLLDGARPALTISDAPYGVSYEPGQRAGARRRGTVANDDRADWSAAWALSPSDVFYLWHSGIHGVEVGAGIEALGLNIRAQIVWTKPALVMGRGAYHWQHEPCFYAVREGADAAWIGDRAQSTVWDVPTVHSTRGTSDDVITNHGTQKPVELLARSIRNHAGDVFDPFLGSGSTLIAAELLGRRCYGLDIDPVWVEVAIKRWEAYTGGHAERL